MEPAWTDGNALAGALGEVFAVEVTTAHGICGSCGTAGSVGEARVYARGPGMVARCRACDQVLLRLVRGPGRAWLDMGGLRSLMLHVTDE